MDVVRSEKDPESGAADVVATSTTSIPEDAKGKLGRTHVDDEPFLGPPGLQMDDNGEVDITTGQKMLSAVSGSLFTSLIGTVCLVPETSLDPALAEVDRIYTDDSSSYAT